MKGDTPRAHEERAAPSGDALETLQAIAILLPPALFAWPGPGSFLRHDLLPECTGAGVAALAALPGLAVLGIRCLTGRAAPSVRALVFYLLPLLAAVSWIGSGLAQDIFQARCAVLASATGLGLLLCGASLERRGRRILARGAVTIAIALLSFALLDKENGFAGALGKTGNLSESALAGALIGAALLVEERGAWRIPGALAVLLFIAYTASVPVIAGAASLAVALAAGACLRAQISPPRRALYAAGAVIAIVAVLAPLLVARFEASAIPTHDARAQAASARDPGDTGGFSVRRLIWSRSLSMLADHALLGVGPGQFSACFPAYRDPREIELSTLARRLPEETEVEHPHNDWLAPVLDAGVIAGLAWIAFLATIAWTSVRRLRAQGGDDAALSLASLGVLANAFVNAPLTSDPTASCLAFAIFGCVLARDESRERSRSRVARRSMPIVALGLMLLGAPRAIALAHHGRALARLGQPGAADEGLLETAVDEALEACPDSTLALTLRARISEARHENPEVVREKWKAVLARRPLRVEAWMQTGRSALLSADYAAARGDYECALALDPGHPGILRNLMSLELEDGHIEAALEYLDRFEHTHPPDEGGHVWLVDTCAHLYLRGQDREAEALLARIGETVITSAEKCYALAKEHRAAGRTLLADSFESRAHRLWARDHARAGRYADAVRSYRQDLRITRDTIEGGAPRVRLELAAALSLAGRDEEAQNEVKDLPVRAPDRESLPAWARDQLQVKGWLSK